MPDEQTANTTSTHMPEANNNAPVAIPTSDHDETQLTKRDDQTETREAKIPRAQSASAILQTLTDKALYFLSHASNETLGACLVGLGATTYWVLGRVGLVIIGVAGGVVLHATWEGYRNKDEAAKAAELQRKRETGVDVARRVLDWRKSETAEEIYAEDVKVYANQALDYSSFDPETAAALNTFTDAVIKDYVLYWYDWTIPGEQSFPASCRRTFMAFVLSLSGHLQHKRPADVFLDFVANASSIIIVFLNELSVALNASPNTPAGDAISAYLKLKPESSLSYMLDQESQKSKLADAAEDMLQSYLDPKAYNCPPVHIFLKQVLANLVLGYTVDMCSNPTWINEWIVYGLEESETTKEVMDIVDAGVEGRATTNEPEVGEQIAEKQTPVQSKKGATTNGTVDLTGSSHRRQMSKAEEAMDEAMREARRLTELMIEEDRRRAEEEVEKRQSVLSSQTIAEDSSDGTAQGAFTPSSSQSGKERREEESMISSEGSALVEEERATTPNTQFTNFDQLVPSSTPTALTDSPQRPSIRPLSASLTLHNANISIFDDSQPGERTSIKAKPTTDYLIQIEPSSTSFSGWVIARKYADFETLHEVLRRISVITGVRFTEAHAELPKWKVHTKSTLRSELERYLTDAVRFQQLAESEGMKRFLEKDQGLNKSPGGGIKSFGWPTPDAFGKIGGDMMNVLTKAPKQVAGGGKAVFGGVAGLVGGGKKAPSVSQTNLSRTATNSSLPATPVPAQEPRPSTDGISHMTDPITGTYLGSVSNARESLDSLRAPPQNAEEQRRGSAGTIDSTDIKPRPSASPNRPASILSQSGSAMLTEASPTTSVAQLTAREPSFEEMMNLPPPPSEMPEDYGSPTSSNRKDDDAARDAVASSRLSQAITLNEDSPPPKPPRPGKGEMKPKKPLSEREASTTIELMFAVITELYTLSGVWQIRKTLLAAAKTFLLRPGNPQLISIRDLLQTSLLNSNLSDSGLAHHIYELRKNTLPTAEEMEAWKRDYPEKTPEQKEELRIKARKLLVTKGMPQALTSVMGAAASGEALGKVFDCLQVSEVSRGLIFGLLLQALRVVTH